MLIPHNLFEKKNHKVNVSHQSFKKKKKEKKEVTQERKVNDKSFSSVNDKKFNLDFI